VKLPITFFLNSDLLVDAGLLFGAEMPLPEPLSRQRVMKGSFYLECLTRYEVVLVGKGRKSRAEVRLPGDAFFAFVTPEPAYEDLYVIQELVRRGVLTDRFVCCSLMVDFPNPVFSLPRLALLRHVPPAWSLPRREPLSDHLAEVILQAAQAGTPESPEAQFAAHWSLGPNHWRDAFAARLEAYLNAVDERLATPEGADELFRLGDSRCREFRRRLLSEFCLTVPHANIDASGPLLQLSENGRVIAKSQGPKGEKVEPSCV
jgi:hypothetical protein